MDILKIDSNYKKQYKVMIVDDDEEFCTLICLVLKKTKMFSMIITAPSVYIAQQKMLNQRFDLLLVDYKLPQRTGLQLIYNLRRMMGYSNTKVILISGHFGNKEVIEAFNTGVKHILVKPFSNQLLVKKIHEILNLPMKKMILDEEDLNLNLKK